MEIDTVRDIASRIKWETHEGYVIPINVMTFSHKVNIIRQVVNYLCEGTSIEPIKIKNPVASINVELMRDCNFRDLLRAIIFLCEEDIRNPEVQITSAYLSIYETCKMKVLQLRYTNKLEYMIGVEDAKRIN